MAKFYSMKNASPKVGEIAIDGEIGPADNRGESIDSKAFALELRALGTINEIHLSINSPGGSVFDGFKIFNILVAHKARVNVSINPVAASIASVIAMAGDEINMAENSMLMVHDAQAGRYWPG